MKSQASTISVTSDCSASPHQIAPPLQSEVGDYAHTFVELSHRRTQLTLDIYTDLACKLVGCHVDSSSQPSSPCFVDPPYCTVLCSSIMDCSPAVNEDQVVNGVGVMQPTYGIVHDECVWESKEEPVVKDDSIPSAPHPLYPNIPCDYATIDFPYENFFLDVSTLDHS